MVKLFSRDALGTKDILAVLPLPLFALFMAHGLTQVIGNLILGWPKPPFNYSEMLAPLGPLWIIGTIYFSITAGLWESIFFIGLPWLWLFQGRRAPNWQIQIFAAVSAILFGWGHWENGIPNAVGAFVFQFYAVWWFHWLRTLWPIIAGHTLIDVYYFWPPPHV